ncbi:MAG: hypothetical protein LBU91_09100 [Bacteroidales bacterium]|jgi:hypothetical protein|nr:hypothetical protein [Bacteroidales bacterium]
MRTKIFLTFFCLWIGTSLLAQAKRDTIFIYDTIRVTVKRPVPPPTENFFEEPTATFSKDSIIIDENLKQKSIMSNFRQSANNFIRMVAVGTMAAISSVAPMVAQENVDTIQVVEEKPVIVDTVKKVIREVIEEFVDGGSDSVLKQAPVNISFIYPMSIYGVHSQEYEYNFSVGALTDVAGGINGIQWSGIYNQVNGSMRGIQWAGLMNLSGQVEGIQWAGICNFSKEVKGLQWAGILNQSGNMRGIQSAGIVSIADDVEGIQWSGIYNAADSLSGMQASAIANEAKYVHGAQMAGIYNRADEVKGLQIGFVNSTKTLSGVQIGFFNKVDTIKSGVSIGLFNFLKKDRFQELEFSHNTYSTSYLTYRIGGYKLHGIMAAGTSWQDGNLAFRLGVGNNTRLVGSLFLQSAIYANNVSYYRRDMKLEYQDNFGTLSCGLAYYWGDKIGLKITPAFNYWVDWDGFGDDRRSSFKDHALSWDVSLDVGLSIKF